MRKVSRVNISSVVMPWLVLLRPHSSPAATMQPLTSTITTSVVVFRVSSVPPLAAKAMPAKAPPAIAGSALAATVEERDTRGRDLGQDRNVGDCRDPLP